MKRFLITLSLCSAVLAGTVLPALAGCLGCHGPAAGVDIGAQLHAPSHHIQGAEPDDRHCYACHWEATADGRVDDRFHRQPMPAGGTPPVRLVIWGPGQRPTSYHPYSTAILFSRQTVGTSGEREALAGISRHCLGCHSDANNDTTPFTGDRLTPRAYAWDRQSVAARYSRRDTVAWGKYSTLAGRGKSRVRKAFSAHGNARDNQGGWSTATGYDSAIPDTRGGGDAHNVECFDCHNAHGSATAGITSSYRDGSGGHNGGLLKETRAGQEGYAMTYAPTANPDRTAANPYQAGAGLCFDCHETGQPGTTPWGYAGTFGAREPIIGYKDTPRFGAGVKGSTARFANRQGHTVIASSHLKGGRFLTYSAHGRINGLCTPCHDPHGISPTLGTDMAYALPLLKGTWLTNPYREDEPPRTLPSKGGFASRDAGGNVSLSWEKGTVGEAAPERQPGMNYNIDRNTFGPTARIAESADRFGGLCLGCHPRENLLDKGRVGWMHRAVKGWGTNREHAFPCAKCHQPHNSGLPRLMQTNCLNAGPASLRAPGELPWNPDVMAATVAADPAPATKGKKPARKETVVGCHVRQGGKSAPPKAPASRKESDSQWIKVTSW